MDRSQRVVEALDQECEKKAAKRAVERRLDRFERKNIGLQRANVRKAAVTRRGREKFEEGRSFVERRHPALRADDLREIERGETRAAAEIGNMLPAPEARGCPQGPRLRLPRGVLVAQARELGGVHADEVIVCQDCKASCTSDTTDEPSPTAAATRLSEPERTSPTANTFGQLVSKNFGWRSPSAL